MTSVLGGGLLRCAGRALVAARRTGSFAVVWIGAPCGGATRAAAQPFSTELLRLSFGRGGPGRASGGARVWRRLQRPRGSPPPLWRRRPSLEARFNSGPPGLLAVCPVFCYRDALLCHSQTDLGLLCQLPNPNTSRAAGLANLFAHCGRLAHVAPRPSQGRSVRRTRRPVAHQPQPPPWAASAGIRPLRGGSTTPPPRARAPRPSGGGPRPRIARRVSVIRPGTGPPLLLDRGPPRSRLPEAGLQHSSRRRFGHHFFDDRLVLHRLVQPLPPVVPPPRPRPPRGHP